MIDTLVILFSLGMVVFIVVRATMLDRMLPWFPNAPAPGPGTRPAVPPPSPVAPARRSGGPAARTRPRRSGR